MLRLASGILMFLGAGHLVLTAYLTRATTASWAAQAFWAAVPLRLEPAARTADALRNVAAFWAGPGSFSVPLFLLGAWIWHLAGRGVAPPSALGWGVTVWCVVGGILLVPSPFFVGALAGVLLVLAAHRAPHDTLPRAPVRSTMPG